MSNYQNTNQLNSTAPINSVHEVLHVKSKKVNCDGSKTASSHPLVYLNMGDNDYVVCPYCSKYFTINPSYPNTQNLQKNKIKN
ncbi:hypothetical protein LBMAG18_07310 [Alphaproteobacteria bacterium]|nr:hypothetical protein LBMAG18_07310 [Alphaproteobacteria bacterium]